MMTTMTISKVISHRGMKLSMRLLYPLAAVLVLGLAVTAPARAHAATGGPITTAQLEQAGGPALNLAYGPSTSTWDYWCSNDFTGHDSCDFYPYGCSSDARTFAQVQLDGSPDDAICKYLDWPGYTFRYSSKYLLLYNASNGCLHIHKATGGDWMDVVTCNTGDKNQRWSFPNGGLEIKSSGDDACVQLHSNAITGLPDAFHMVTCNASQSYQDWKWFPPGK